MNYNILTNNSHPTTTYFKGLFIYLFIYLCCDESVAAACLPARQLLGGVKIKINIYLFIFFGAKEKSIAKRKG
jgi:hypothetical protein